MVLLLHLYLVDPELSYLLIFSHELQFDVLHLALHLLKELAVQELKLFAPERLVRVAVDFEWTVGACEW